MDKAKFLGFTEVYKKFNFKPKAVKLFSIPSEYCDENTFITADTESRSSAIKEFQTKQKHLKHQTSQLKQEAMKADTKMSLELANNKLITNMSVSDATFVTTLAGAESLTNSQVSCPATSQLQTRLLTINPLIHFTAPTHDMSSTARQDLFLSSDFLIDESSEGLILSSEFNPLVDGHDESAESAEVLDTSVDNIILSSDFTPII